MLETVKTWLQTYPGWEGIQLDYVDTLPGNSGLYPRGITELSAREDVLGNKQVRYRSEFLLRKATGGSQEDARWLLDFQQWVARQDAMGLIPQFGDEPKTERVRAFAGRLDSHKQVGSALYTVQLTVEFTKLYRGE